MPSTLLLLWRLHTLVNILLAYLYARIMRVRVHTYIAVDPIPCGEISRVAFIGKSLQKHVATFQGRRDFEVWRDFKEI